MKKTKWAAMAAAMLFLVSAYLGTSPALARYLNSEQYFTTHAAENRSLTVEVGQTGAGNFLTSDGAAFLVTGARTIPCRSPSPMTAAMPRSFVSPLPPHLVPPQMRSSF